MRLLVVIAGCAAMAASPTAARGSVGMSVGDLHATHEVLQKRAQSTSLLEGPGSPLARISKANRKWIRAETKRQVAQPRSLEAVFGDVHTTLAEDAADVGKSLRIDPMDVTRIVTLLILVDAENAAQKAARKARASGDEALAAKAAQQHAEAVTRRDEARQMQTLVSLQLAAM